MTYILKFIIFTFLKVELNIEEAKTIEGLKGTEQVKASQTSEKVQRSRSESATRVPKRIGIF